MKTMISYTHFIISRPKIIKGHKKQINFELIDDYVKYITYILYTTISQNAYINKLGKIRILDVDRSTLKQIKKIKPQCALFDITNTIESDD